MEISEWYRKSFDGLDMYARSWAPQGKPKAVLALVVGHGEHVGRYEHVGAALANKGYTLLGFDLRGHGKSSGRRGFIPSYQALLNDITDFLRQVDERYPGIPCFLYGNSLGGNLVLNYVLRHKPDLQGVIATAAWLKLAYKPPAYKILLGRLMNGIVPGFTQHTKLDARGFSHDQTVVRHYQDDPLVHDAMSARLFVGIYENGMWALKHAAEFPLPLLLMHGGADPIISLQAVQEFAERAGDRATLKIWDGMYHEIHNELEKEQVLAYMINWLDKHLSELESHEINPAFEQKAGLVTGQTASIMAKSCHYIGK
jgi:alpha-beta hydrolase superfamily lysophospholipase